MTIIVFVFVCLAAALVLALGRARIFTWAVATVLATAALKAGAPGGELSVTPELWSLPGWIPALVLLVLSVPAVRRLLIAGPAYGALKGIMPKLSATEHEALEAGTVGFDAELFSGKPDWSKLRAIPPMTLSKEEQDFIDGPVDELCRMLDDWDIR